jgi:hypothetical protein
VEDQYQSCLPGFIGRTRVPASRRPESRLDCMNHARYGVCAGRQVAPSPNHLYQRFARERLPNEAEGIYLATMTIGQAIRSMIASSDPMCSRAISAS